MAEPAAKRSRAEAPTERVLVPTDELAVVTGGSSGIGQATSLRLLASGWAVVVMSPVQKELDELQKVACDSVNRLLLVCADIRESSGCQAVADAVRSSGKTLRLLVHNASVNTPCKMMMDLSREEWTRVMDINMNGPLYLTQALYELFGRSQTERNRILFLQTIAKTCTGLPNYGPYCVSKLGASGVAKMFQEELPKGDPAIHVTTLIPGEVNTGMQQATAYSSSHGFPEHLVKHWRKLHETKQLLPPAVAAAFLEFVLCDTNIEEFASREWFMYDKDHHRRWAAEFPAVCLEEPKGLVGDH